MHDDTRLQRQFDRLADGEATVDETRTLLDHCEQSPDSWRLLALAFVEGMALRAALREIAAPEPTGRWSDPRHAPRAVGATSGHATAAGDGPGDCACQRGRAGRRLAAAICVIAALAGAFVAGRATLDDRAAAPIADRPRAAPIRAAGVDPSIGSGIAGDVLAGNAIANEVADAPAGAAGDTLSVVFTDPQTSAARTVQVPVVDADSVDPKWLTDAESVVPGSVRAALGRLGHQIQVERRLYPVDLGDGRQVLLPVDDVQVQFVGQREYQ